MYTCTAHTTLGALNRLTLALQWHGRRSPVRPTRSHGIIRAVWCHSPRVCTCMIIAPYARSRHLTISLDLPPWLLATLGLRHHALQLRVGVGVAAIAATTSLARVLLLVVARSHLHRRVPLCLPNPLHEQHNFFLWCREGLELLAKHVLDALVDLNIVLRYDGDGAAGTASACSTTHAVDVVLRVRRQLVIDDQIDRRDIEPASSHVSRNEHIAVARLELVERGETFGLRELAVERHGREAKRAQHERKALHRRTRCTKDDRRMSRELIAHICEVAVLVLGGNEEVLLDEGLDGAVLGGDFDLHWVRQRRALQLLHL
mmetsp:Transcript_2733/g.7566  ORF Transcript_2733/g.7566 Transcript_2733/m.7566 type:complete len:317 (-) Transcript_2733:770-1720(-)